MTGRWRAYWRGVVIAAAVSLRQIGALSGPDEDRPAEAPPYVLMTDYLDADGFAPGERIGPVVLTQTIISVNRPSPN